MATPIDMERFHADHAQLITGMDSLYRLLIDLDYLRSDEVQFPPHDDQAKDPLATASIETAGLTDEAKQLIQLLPTLNTRGEELFCDEEGTITLTAGPVSYIDRGETKFTHYERMFGWKDDGTVDLPPWALLVLAGSNQYQTLIIYDTRTRKLSEIGIYEPTIEVLEAASKEPEVMFNEWIENLKTLNWVLWRVDDALLGARELPEDDGKTLAEPERVRQEIEARWPGKVDEVFERTMSMAKEGQNGYWSKRLIYERAGWPDALDKEALRRGIKELDDGWRAAGVTQEEHERLAAGPHGY